ncbi:MAG: MliC family protein [Rhodobacteraceae bacterium]|nr:MliC family protein [Paracoccaceae bacterium]
MRRAILAVVFVAAPLAAAAEMSVTSLRYSCERGVEVAASYVNGADGSAVVLQVEGRQIALLTEPSGSGARYGWPSDGAGYVWWTKGPEAMLLWREAGTESELLTRCRERP